MEADELVVELYFDEVSDETLSELHERSSNPQLHYSALYRLLETAARNKKVCMNCAKTWRWFKGVGIQSIVNEYNTRGLNQ